LLEFGPVDADLVSNYQPVEYFGIIDSGVIPHFYHI
jgi:hypothetical protein